MNSLRLSLFISILLTSSAMSTNMETTINCKDGKCFASFVPSAEKETQSPQEATSVVIYEVEQEEDFVPFEIDEVTVEVETESDQTAESITPTIQEDELIMVNAEIEYVCEEGSVMCDIDTQMCICA